MRAALYDRFGPSSVLRVRDVPAPTPGPGELVVRVRAAALNPKDVLSRLGKLRLLSGSRFPQRVGFDWAGEVTAIGPRVSGVKLGDARYGMIRSSRAGACAELARVRADESAPKPPSLGFEEAAAIPLAALTALQALRDLAHVRRGSRVLVNGASGGVGVFAVQLAKELGARVSGTCSVANLALVRELGADEAIDYRAEDPLRRAGAFDAIFDVFGNRRFREAAPALAPDGTYVSTVLRGHVFASILGSFLSRKKAKLVVVRPTTRDLEVLANLVERGRLRPIVDSVHSLDDIAAAEDRVATKHARGKVIVRVD